MKKLFSILMVLLLLVGCSGGKDGGGEEAAPLRTVTIQAPTPIISMDHHIATDGTSFIAATMCISGLMELDAAGNPLPDMAESYELSDDGLTYTFHIRDAKWSNGDPVTANDFVFGWDRLTDPDTASDYSWMLETACVESYEAVDDKTFVVKLSSPSGFFVALTAFPSFFPMNEKFVKEKAKELGLAE